MFITSRVRGSNSRSAVDENSQTPNQPTDMIHWDPMWLNAISNSGVIISGPVKSCRPLWLWIVFLPESSYTMDEIKMTILSPIVSHANLALNGWQSSYCAACGARFPWETSTTSPYWTHPSSFFGLMAFWSQCRVTVDKEEIRWEKYSSTRSYHIMITKNEILILVRHFMMLNYL